LFLYVPLAVERFGYLVVAFFAAFSVVLSHQLAAFLCAFILPPVLLFMLIKSRGAHLKVVLALIFGGGIAFFLYYFQAMVGYLDIMIYWVFFGNKTYAYQIPSVSFDSLMINFGFVFLFALAGLAIATYNLKKQNKTIFYLTLLLSFFVPLFFAESYLFGLYLPFQWFLYYLLIPTAILAAVALVFAAGKIQAFYVKNMASLRRNWVKILTVGLIVAMGIVLVFRADTVYGRIMQASDFYSTTDIKAWDAGVWLKANYPDNTTVVDTEVPGFWFQEFSGKNVTAQTDPTVERNEVAESVLSLSYEVQGSYGAENPQILLRGYEANGRISDENYVSFNHVWRRVSYSSDDGNFLYLNQNGVKTMYVLQDMSKQIVFDDARYPKQISFIYSNDEVQLTKTLQVYNDSYSLGVSWTVTPLRNDVSNITLYLSNFFDFQFFFDIAKVPQLMDWVNPWNITNGAVNGSTWTAVNFPTTAQNHFVGLYDVKNNVAFAYNFTDYPVWGSVGALGNRQIDAVRFEYQFIDVKANQSASRSYQYLSISKNSYPALQPNGVEALLSTKISPLTLACRDYRDYIAQYKIGFIVYDKNKLDTKMCHSKILQLIYSNDRYVIFKVLR